MSDLSIRLKKARIAAGISQAELARRIGAGQSTIASIENGRNNGSGRLVDIAKELQVRPEWLALGDGPMGEDTPTGERPSSWPFPSISEAQVRALAPDHLSKLEGAMILTLAQLKTSGQKR